MSAIPPDPGVALGELAHYREDWPAGCFLRALSSQALATFVESGRIQRFEREQQLIIEGDASTDVFLLLSACVKVTADLGGGRRALLAVRLGGDVVGELAATDGERRLATVTACGREPVVAAVLSRHDFEAAMRTYPEAARTLSTVITRKLRTATRRRIDYVGCRPEIRLARALAELADDYGQNVAGRGIVIRVNLTQIELGTLVGVSEATAQRSLRELRKRKLIEVNGRRPIVPNRGALRAACDEAWWSEPVV